MKPSEHRGRMAEQVDYYRARASEYDQWWERAGRYDRGDAHTLAWRAEVGEIVGWVDSLDLRGDVLEIAAGTGNFTLELARTADRVTALDSSPETLQINERKIDAARSLAERAGRKIAAVEHVAADIFAWEPSRRFDHVFFSFWLSHVPDDMVAAFFEIVDGALGPGGRAVAVDNLGGPTDETNVVEASGFRNDVRDDTTGAGLSVRELNDGRQFTIVKVYRSPARVGELVGPGWVVDGSHETPSYFTGVAVRRR